MEIDEKSFAIFDHDVLRLEIAMQQDTRERGEFRRYIFESGAVAVGVDDGGVHLEPAAKAVFKKIILLPEIKLCVKFLLKLQAGALRGNVCAGV